MKNPKINRAFFSLSIVLFAALAGCAGVVPVKDVLSDQDAYIAQNFSLKNIPADIRKKLPPVNSPAKVGRTVKFQMEGHFEGRDGKTEVTTGDSFFTYLGEGIFEVHNESIANGIPFSKNFSLMYQGFITVRSQHVRLGSTESGHMMELKQVTKLEALPPKPGQSNTAEYTLASIVQIMNFQPSKLQCTGGEPYPAAKIHPNLSGQAINLDCDFYMNDAVSSRSKRIYLVDYGFAITTEATTSTTKDHFIVKNVQVSG